MDKTQNAIAISANMTGLERSTLATLKKDNARQTQNKIILKRTHILKILETWNELVAQDSTNNLPYSLNILINDIPNFLRPFLTYAQELENHIFASSPKLFSIRSLHLQTLKYTDPADSDLTKFVRYSNVVMSLAFEDLTTFGNSSDDFFQVLNNSGKGCLLRVVEHMLHEPGRIHYDQFRINSIENIKEHVLAAMLSANVDENTLRKLFKTGVYKYNRLMSKIKTDLQENGNFKSEPIGWQAMIHNNVKCRFASLIISLYCLCMRVMFDKEIPFHSLNLKYMPSMPSYIIATGCYLCVREVYSAMYFNYWSKAFFLEFFPNIEDIFELLDLLLHKKVEIVYCCKCRAPYFRELDKKITITRTKNKMTIMYKDQKCNCPNCASALYFKRNDK